MRPSPGGPAIPDEEARAGMAPRLAAEATTRVPLALAGVGAALVLLASWATVRPPFDAALALVIVVGAVHGLLGWDPRLRVPARVGLRSFVAYGLVLLLYLLLTPGRLGSESAPVLWTRLGCGLVLAAVVHQVLGRAAGPGPEGARAWVPGWREVAVLALLPGVVATMVLVVNGTPGGARARPPVAVQLAVGEPGEDIAGALTFPSEGPTAVTPAAEGPPPTGADPGATARGPDVLTAATGGRPAARQGTTSSTAARPAAPTTVAPLRPVRMLISGESTAGATGGGIRTWGKRTGRAEVEVVGTNACALQQDGEAILRDGWTQPKNAACLHLIDYTVEVAATFRPDLIVLFIGSNQLSDWLLPGETVATHIGEPAFDQLYTRSATAALRKLTSLGVPVLFTTTPVPAWDPAVQTGDPNVPGTGPIKMNDAGRTRRLNQLTAAVVRSLPLTEMAPYAERISNPDGTVPSSIRPDGVHLKQEAVPGIMDRGLEADLRSAYLQVSSRVPSAARAGHHWSKA